MTGHDCDLVNGYEFGRENAFVPMNGHEDELRHLEWGAPLYEYYCDGHVGKIRASKEE